jgi:hypothetical protein
MGVEYPPVSAKGCNAIQLQAAAFEMNLNGYSRNLDFSFTLKIAVQTHRYQSLAQSGASLPCCHEDFVRLAGSVASRLPVDDHS